MAGFEPKDIKMPSAYQLAAFESLDSTNDELRRRAQDNCPANTVVWALEQTKGRGRRGRDWISAPGNLFCSILLKPKYPIAECAKASFVASLAIHSAVAQVVADRECKVECKWPNDVLIDGQKVSGILLESQAKAYMKDQPSMLDWLIVGIGINLAHSPAETPYPSGYINAYRENILTPEKMLEILLHHFQIWFELWENEGFGPIRSAWLERAKGLGDNIIE
jgi:BirA family transcriptional regulator, biotin operon repressor / biotin---[acetyl-CoA-carboxylase] ligase